MKIIVGPGYGGRRANVVKPSFGELICDGQGLVAELELRAGIAYQTVSETKRTVMYLKALRAADHPDRFYHRSLQVDPIACARKLLHWRDSAILYGWRVPKNKISRFGNVEPSSSVGRLRDLDLVEEHLSDFPPCLAERSIRLFEHLEPICRSLSALEIHGSASTWPTLFQRLFEEIDRYHNVYALINGLKKSSGKLNPLRVYVHYKTEWVFSGWPYAEPGELAKLNWSQSREKKQRSIYKRRDGIDEHVIHPCITASEDTNLGRLQRKLIGQDATPYTRDDDSVVYHSAINYQAAAGYASAVIKGTNDHLVIAGEEPQLLNNALVWREMPESGLGEASRWRAQLQLLPALLALVWHPPSAEAVLSYLTLPAGPHRTLRQQLARHFADLPGIDGDAWEESIGTYIQRRVERYPDTDSNSLSNSITSWFPVACAREVDTVTCVKVIELSEMVARYWRGRAQNDIANRISPIAASAAQATAEAVAHWPHESISRIQLERILNQIAEEFSIDASLARCVSPANIVERGDASIPEKFETLLYWGVAIPGAVITPPFASEESDALPWFPSQLQQGATSQAILNNALLPVIKATHQLVLVQLDNSPTPLKVYFDHLLGLNCSEWPLLETKVLEGSISIPLRKAITLPFPKKQRWWQVPENSIPARAKQSYSSLSTLIKRPHEYVLQYGAKIRRGSLQALNVDNRLYGNLAHRIIEIWFKEYPWNVEADYQPMVEQWLNKNIDELAYRFALPLLAQGKQSEKLAFIRTINHALQQLLRHLKGARAVSIETEYQLVRQESFGELEGSLDILVTLEGGSSAVVDMKWGGESNRTDELAESRHMQLAVYQHLMEQRAEVSGVAYFIIKTGRLLATDRLTFPDVDYVEPDASHLSTGTLWQEMTKVIDWRLAQLQKGSIEVTYDSCPPDEHSKPADTAIDLVKHEFDQIKKQKNKQGSFGKSFKEIDDWRVVKGWEGK